jgi:hypothetical protein
MLSGGRGMDASKQGFVLCTEHTGACAFGNHMSLRLVAQPPIGGSGALGEPSAVSWVKEYGFGVLYANLCMCSWVLVSRLLVGA